MTSFYSGFIAVVGRTNVGKSTLLNTILGQKLSIVSEKPQTTRNNIRMIYTTDSCQMVFIDTPGFHRPKSRLSSWMVASATNSLLQVDVVLLVLEEDDKIGKGDQLILDKLSALKTPVIAVVNKVDKIPREDVLAKIAKLSEYSFIKEIVPVSALKNENVDTLLSVLKKYLPEGPMYFPDDIVSDRAEKFFLSEILREKCLFCLKEEIPHGVAVSIESVKDRNSSPITDIEGVIYCDRESHKGIIIGKGGSMLRRIGSLARRDMEDMLDNQVNLKLWVRVRKGWREKESELKGLGYLRKDEIN